MKLRPLQLVCLALLLAALRLADPTALAPQDFALRAGVLQALLGNELQAETRLAIAAPGSDPRPALPLARGQNASLSTASAHQIFAVLPAPPPALHSAALQTHTGLLHA